MRIALLCPSNPMFMPYLNNYKRTLDNYNVDYELIIWDRFQIEDTRNNYVYRDKKKGHQRNLLDYIEFTTFIKKTIREFDKLIVFGIQLTFFIRNFLKKEFKNRYIIDIRDHNKILKYVNLKNIFDNSYITVLSSAGYKEWLPESDRYVINHNTQLTNIQDLKPLRKYKKTDGKIKIGTIGALRDLEINKELISALKDSLLVELVFHGEGIINKHLKSYLIDMKIKNVILTGRYKQNEEPKLYKDKHLINVLRYNDGINNNTALPNRLYNAAMYGIPMIAFEGTYLTDIIKKYNLGIVINSFHNLETGIYKYLNSINEENYYNGREQFFRKVIYENKKFSNKLLQFIEV